MKSIYVDYNAEQPDGRFFARASRLPDLPVGQLVPTHDDDGNTALMTVDQVDGATGLVYFRPDWSTWTDGRTDPDTAPVRFSMRNVEVYIENIGLTHELGITISTSLGTYADRPTLAPSEDQPLTISELLEERETVGRSQILSQERGTEIRFSGPGRPDRRGPVGTG